MNELPAPPRPEAPTTMDRGLTDRATADRAPAGQSARRRPRRLVLAGAALLAALAALAWARGWPPFAAAPAVPPAGGFGPGGGPRGRAATPIPVSAVAAATRDLPLYLDALGTVQAFNTITIVPQVSGRLMEVSFREGQEVRAGDVLVRLDPRSYEAALNQVMATRAQHAAQLANARLDLARYTQLLRSNGASQQQLDTQRATVAQLEAQLQFDDASIEAARVQLDYTTIRSPVDGRVGLRLVDVGNLVQTSSTGIVVVTQLRPINVTFTLPQQSLPQVIEAIAAGPVPVSIRLAESAAPRADGAAPPPDPVGELVTLDNQVDQATGTIRLKATFANQDQRLWPGAFVNVRMRAATLQDVTTIPLVAVQRGPDGPFVFVVRADNTVEQRPIGLGVMQATDAVVTRGLRPGEAVVTSGALRLAQGSAVQVAEPVQPPPRQPPRRRGQGEGARPGGALGGPSAPGAVAPEGAPRIGTPEGAPRIGTPEGAPRIGTPEGAPRSATPEGAPRSATPEGAPRNATPEGAPRSAAPEGAPRNATPEGATQGANRNRTAAPDAAATAAPR